MKSNNSSKILDVVRKFMRYSLGLLSSTSSSDIFCEDETTVASQIRSKLSGNDALNFDKLLNDLKDKVSPKKRQKSEFCPLKINFFF